METEPVDVEQAKRDLEEAIEKYAKTVNDPGDTVHGYVLQIVTANLDDMSSNWHSPLIRPAWQPYYATLGLVEYVYRNFHMPEDEDD